MSTSRSHEPQSSQSTQRESKEIHALFVAFVVFVVRSSRFSLRNRLEVTVHLLLVLRRRLVVGAGRQSILRSLGLQLFRERRLDGIERQGCLSPQIVPLRKILFERFGARRRYRHSSRFLECKAAVSAAGERRILATHLVDEILRLAKLPHVLFTQPREVRSAGAATLLAFAGAATAALTWPGRVAARRSSRLAALPVLTTAAVLPSRVPELTSAGPELFAQVLRARELLGQLPRFSVAGTGTRRERLRDLVHGTREILLRADLTAGLIDRVGWRRRAAPPAWLGRRLTKRIGRLLHAIGKLLPLELLGCCVRGRLCTRVGFPAILARRASARIGGGPCPSAAAA